MLKIVLDINVLISAFIIKGNEYKVFELGEENKVKIVLSSEVFEDFKNVIHRKKFGFSEEQLKIFIQQVIDVAEIINSLSRFDAIKEDSDDNRILEAAFDGKADYIISGDQHLLKLKEFKGIKIVNGKDFLSIFGKVNE